MTPEMPLEALHLPVRSYNAIKRQGIDTAGALRRRLPELQSKYRRAGADAEKALRKHGLLPVFPPGTVGAAWRQSNTCTVWGRLLPFLSGFGAEAAPFS